MLAERPGDAVAARWRDEVVHRATAQGLAQMPRSAAAAAPAALALRRSSSRAAAAAPRGRGSPLFRLLARTARSATPDPAPRRTHRRRRPRARRAASRAPCPATSTARTSSRWRAPWSAPSRARGYLVAEAGTGTGKTLAYLVPGGALRPARDRLHRHQDAAGADLVEGHAAAARAPAASSSHAAYLKGRSNYFCLARADEFARAPTFAVREEAALWPRIEAWARETETGDRARSTCPTSSSPGRTSRRPARPASGASATATRSASSPGPARRAAEADVLLVNHHLFFADLAMRTSRAGVEILPEHDVVVFDEAHAIEDVATEYFGLQVSSYRVEELARDALRAVADRPDLASMMKRGDRRAAQGRASGSSRRWRTGSAARGAARGAASARRARGARGRARGTASARGREEDEGGARAARRRRGRRRRARAGPARRGARGAARPARRRGAARRSRRSRGAPASCGSSSPRSPR